MGVPIDNLVLKNVEFLNSSIYSGYTYLPIYNVVNLTLENLYFSEFIHSDEGLAS